MNDMLRHFKVWDPAQGDDTLAQIFSAYGPAEAAEKFAAVDERAHWHLYESGHVLHCRAMDGEFLTHTYRVEVKAEYTPRYQGRFLG
jgi:hypothetical protein